MYFTLISIFSLIITGFQKVHHLLYTLPYFVCGYSDTHCINFCLLVLLKYCPPTYYTFRTLHTYIHTLHTYCDIYSIHTVIMTWWIDNTGQYMIWDIIITRCNYTYIIVWKIELNWWICMLLILRDSEHFYCGHNWLSFHCRPHIPKESRPCLYYSEP